MMDSNTTQQVTVIPADLPAITTADGLRRVRMDRRTYPHFKDAEKRVRLNWLYKQVGVCYMLLHQKPDKEQVKFDVVALEGTIMEDVDMRELTFVEIENALRNGTNGMYGDYIGLTTRTFYGFLRTWIKKNMSVYHSLLPKEERDPRLDRVTDYYASVMAQKARDW